jgi:hypothetical protein
MEVVGEKRRRLGDAEMTGKRGVVVRMEEGKLQRIIGGDTDAVVVVKKLLGIGVGGQIGDIGWRFTIGEVLDDSMECRVGGLGLV